MEPVRFLKLLTRPPIVLDPPDAPLSGTTEGNDLGAGEDKHPPRRKGWVTTSLPPLIRRTRELGGGGERQNVQSLRNRERARAKISPQAIYGDVMKRPKRESPCSPCRLAGGKPGVRALYSRLPFTQRRLTLQPSKMGATN